VERKSRGDLQRSIELAQKALSLDDSNSDALGVLTYVYMMEGRHDLTLATAERAVAVNPNCAQGYGNLSNALNNSARPEEALRAAERAIRLDPSFEDLYAYMVGISYVEMGRYQESIPVLKRNLASYPNNLVAHLYIIVAYTELGRDRDAQAEAAEIMQSSPRFTLASLSGVKDERLNQRFFADFRKAGLK
jgi:adenylate cyclase